MAPITIDIDTGGTFTDGFVVSDGKALTVKTLSTPHDLLVCFRAVLEDAAELLDRSVGEMLAGTEAIRYSTTVGTNAVLQRRGPKLGALLGDGDPELENRLGGALELFGASGLARPVRATAEAEAAPDQQQAVVEPIQALLQEGARGLVCVVPGAAGGAAEKLVRQRFESHYPSHCLDAVPLLLSREMDADEDDARRGATALFNAYVHPEVADFLYRAEDYLREQGYRRPLRVVHNDGRAGRVAKTIAAKTYNSGPTAGLVGAAELARDHGEDALVTLDMGGTSSDVAVIEGGVVPLRERGAVDGIEISLPLVDLIPLGGGGGSIAWTDEDGTLRVGPRSAGASPGPACFGFGGTEPTTTDADLVLGVIDAGRFLDGRMKVDRGLAEKALQPLAEELGVDVPGAALTVSQALHRQLGTSLAEVIAERGLATPEATLLAFGGAGPTHACGIAAAAGVRRVLVSPFAPVFSAYGVSTTDVEHVATVAKDVGEEALRESLLRQMAGEGFAAEEVTLEIAEEDGLLHGRCVRVMPHYEHPSAAAPAHPATAAATRPVTWSAQGPESTEIYDAAGLDRGAELAGPAVIEAGGTTIAVPAGWSLRVDGSGIYELTQREEESR